MNTICDVFLQPLVSGSLFFCSCLRSTWSDFSWRSFQECFRMLRSLVRQLIHVWRQSMRLHDIIYELCRPSERGWYWCGFGRPSLEREVQLDFRVHSSSCGAQCGVHSPFEWLDHRCHCNCRDLVLFVGRLPRCGGVCVAMSCGGRGLLLIVLRFCLGQREADDWKILLQLLPVPRGRWVCMHAELLVQQQ